MGAGGTGATSAYGANDALNTQGADIASAATVNLANATGVYVNITGTVTITGLGTVGAGIERETTFTGILTLTHNATSLILPGAANIVTAAGDVARWRSLGSGNWKCVGYTRAATAPFNNVLTQPALTLEQSAAPTPTAEGRIQWDTDDDAIVVGDGAATRIFLPIPAGTVAGDTLYLSAAKVLSRLAKGTALQGYRMNAGATAPEWATTDFGAGNAALAAGAVGTWGLFITSPAANLIFGATIAGSAIQPTHAGGFAAGNAPSGTWRCMGVTTTAGGTAGATSVFMRIS